MWSSTGQKDSVNRIKKTADSVANTEQPVFVFPTVRLNSTENKHHKSTVT
jgi:hypothetical protein